MEYKNSIKARSFTLLQFSLSNSNSSSVNGFFIFFSYLILPIAAIGFLRIYPLTCIHVKNELKQSLLLSMYLLDAPFFIWNLVKYSNISSSVISATGLFNSMKSAFNCHLYWSIVLCDLPCVFLVRRNILRYVCHSSLITCTSVHFGVTS